MNGHNYARNEARIKTITFLKRGMSFDLSDKLLDLSIPLKKVENFIFSFFFNLHSLIFTKKKVDGVI